MLLFEETFHAVCTVYVFHRSNNPGQVSFCLYSGILHVFMKYCPNIFCFWKDCYVHRFRSFPCISTYNRQALYHYSSYMIWLTYCSWMNHIFTFSCELLGAFILIFDTCQDVEVEGRSFRICEILCMQLLVLWNIGWTKV